MGPFPFRDLSLFVRLVSRRFGANGPFVKSTSHRCIPANRTPPAVLEECGQLRVAAVGRPGGGRANSPVTPMGRWSGVMVRTGAGSPPAGRSAAVRPSSGPLRPVSREGLRSGRIAHTSQRLPNCLASELPSVRAVGWPNRAVFEARSVRSAQCSSCEVVELCGSRCRKVRTTGGAARAGAIAGLRDRTPEPLALQARGAACKTV